MKIHLLPIFLMLLSITSLFITERLVTSSGVILIRNFSDSEGKGLFIVRKKESYKRGDLVLISFPEKLKALSNQREWLKDAPLLKTIAALEGDRVCHKSDGLYINGTRVAKIYKTDRNGEALPQIHGCYVIPDTYFLPLGTKSDKSFDGRYFGALRKSTIIGAALHITNVKR